MCHVLIIEDEPLVALSIENVLEAEGATSFAFAATEADAIAAAEARRPALITSDVKLLDGTGPLAVAEIHSRIGPIPVLFVTATPEDCHPCDSSAIILAKPFQPALLASAFRSLLPPART